MIRVFGTVPQLRGGKTEPKNKQTESSWTEHDYHETNPHSKEPSQVWRFFDHLLAGILMSRAHFLTVTSRHLGQL